MRYLIAGYAGGEGFGGRGAGRGGGNPARFGATCYQLLHYGKEAGRLTAAKVARFRFA